MSYKTDTIAKVITGITATQYVMPSIQREFCWKEEQIETLFDSLMNDYPIGTFLFWDLNGEQKTRYNFYRFLQKYHQKDAFHCPEVKLQNGSNTIAVLDGQQRLTSLYIGLTGSYASKLANKRYDNPNAYPEKYLYFNLVEMSKDENEKNIYEFKFTEDEKIKNDKNHYWFKVQNIMNIKEQGECLNFVMKNIYKNENIPYSEEQKNNASNFLSKLFNIIHQKEIINYYEVSEFYDLDKVLDIFVRVNSGGTVLSNSDLLLSIATQKWGELNAREVILKFVDDVNEGNFNISKDLVLKACLVLSDITNIAFKVKNFDNSNMGIIEEKWDAISKAINNAFALVKSFGFSKENLSSNNAIIPIAYYLMLNNKPTIENKLKIKRYLILSTLKKVFSGQTDTILRNLREVIKNNKNADFPLDEISEQLKKINKSLDFTDDDITNVLNCKYGSPETFCVLSILYPNLDLEKNQFHIDHIYPKSKFTKQYLKENNVPSEKIQDYFDCKNDIANLQLLEGLQNQSKNDKDFADWFSENFKTDEQKSKYKKENFIPDDMEYTWKNFENFLIKRREFLKNKLTEELCNENV